MNMNCGTQRARAFRDWLSNHGMQVFSGRPTPRPALLLAMACAVGVCCSRFPCSTGLLSHRLVLYWCMTSFALGVWCLLIERQQFRLAWIVILIAAACAMAGWSTAHWKVFPENDLAWALSTRPRPVALRGIVVNPPQILSSTPPSVRRAESSVSLTTMCIVDIQYVRHKSMWIHASGSAVMYIDGPRGIIAQGDYVRVFGRGSRPRSIHNPRDIHYEKIARSRRCLSIIRTHAGSVSVIRARLNSYASVENLRSYFHSVLNTYIGSRQAKLASAILLGKRSALSRDDTQVFAATGTIHVLCISGLHISILAYAVGRLMRVFPVRHAWVIFLIIVITGFYILIVGIRIPVLRATVVIWCACLASCMRRRSDGINALAVAAIGILVWKPTELFSVGTQLSFLATAVLMSTSSFCHISRYIDDPIERLIERSRSSGEKMLRVTVLEIQQFFFAAFAVWVVTAPLVAAHFNLFTPVAAFINVLVTPIVALSMSWGLLCLATAWFSQILACVFGWACNQTLEGLTTLVEIAADVPGAYFWVAGPQRWWVCGWYICIAVTWWLVVPEKRRQFQVWLFVLGSWVLLGVGSTAFSSWLNSHPTGMRVLVTSLGHGCGIVVRGPRGQCLVYDAGRLGAPQAASRAMSGILWDEGIRRIDKLVVSHADADHFNALPDLIERFLIGELIVSDHFLHRDNAAVHELLMLVHQSRIPVRTVAAGDSIVLGESFIVRVLHPQRASGILRGRVVSDNESSVVASVEAFGRSVLLTGDIEGSALREFVATDPKECDILIAPHHGSYTSLPPDIAVATRPDLVIASGLGGSRWPDVAEAYAHARRDGKRTIVLKTGDSGALRVDLGVQGMTEMRYQHGEWHQLSIGM